MSHDSGQQGDAYMRGGRLFRVATLLDRAKKAMEACEKEDWHLAKIHLTAAETVAHELILVVRRLAEDR